MRGKMKRVMALALVAVLPLMSAVIEMLTGLI